MMFEKSRDTIETERLILRPWEATQEFAEGLYSYAKSDNVGPHAGWKPHADVEESMNIINNLFLNDPCGWAIVLKENGRIIGHIGAYEDSARESVNSMEIGYALSGTPSSLAMMVPLSTRRSAPKAMSAAPTARAAICLKPQVAVFSSGPPSFWTGMKIRLSM